MSRLNAQSLTSPTDGETGMVRKQDLVESLDGV